MTRTAQVEAQLSAMAAAADRTNRPASLLNIPLLLVLGALLLAAWEFRDMQAQRAMLRREQERVQKVTLLTEQIAAERKKELNVQTLYPPAPFFGSQVDEIWKSQGITFRESPSVGAVTKADVFVGSPVVRSEVACSVSSEPVESVVAWIQSIQEHEYLKGRVFVSQILLTPLPTGWRAAFRVGLYEPKS